MFEIVLNGVNIGYGQKKVAENLSATIAEGSLTCLLGRNGVGKSTLLKTLCGHLRPSKNGVFIGKNDISELSPRALSRLVGVVLTQRPDVRGITVAQMVEMGRQPYTNLFGTLQDADRLIVEEAMRQVGILSLRHRLVDTLSDGEAQKTMIAKALAQQTPVILLDEPTAFLDYPSKVEVLTLLRRLAHERQKTIVLSTHEVELAKTLADTLLYMEASGLETIRPDDPRLNPNIPL